MTHLYISSFFKINKKNQHITEILHKLLKHTCIDQTHRNTPVHLAHIWHYIGKILNRNITLREEVRNKEKKKSEGREVEEKKKEVKNFQNLYHLFEERKKKYY